MSERPVFRLRGGEDWRAPWDDYRRLRDESPVHFVPAAGDNTDFWVLSRFAHVFGAVRDTETFSSAEGLTPNADAMAMFEEGQQPIVMMDPPDHTAMRRLVSRQMTPRRVASIEDAVRGFVDERLDRVADVGGEAVDIIETLFKPLPSFVVAHYLGVPNETRASFDEWTNAIVAAGNGRNSNSGGSPPRKKRGLGPPSKKGKAAVEAHLKPGMTIQNSQQVGAIELTRRSLGSRLELDGLVEGPNRLRPQAGLAQARAVLVEAPTSLAVAGGEGHAVARGGTD